MTHDLLGHGPEQHAREAPLTFRTDDDEGGAARLVDQGLPVHVDRTFSLAQYPEAIERLTNGEQLGKIVLRHDRNVPERTTT